MCCLVAFCVRRQGLKIVFLRLQCLYPSQLNLFIDRSLGGKIYLGVKKPHFVMYALVRKNLNRVFLKSEANNVV